MNAPVRRPPRDLSQSATQGLGGIKHPMISRNGNRFTLIDTAGSMRPWPQLSIDVVITDVGPNVNRMYFEGDYEPGAGEPPACFSDNGTGPSREARLPQHPTCTGCPQAAWGSKVTQQGNEVPACQSGKKLAVLVQGDPAGLVYEFRVPPGSFNHKPAQDPWEGGWLWYVGALKGQSPSLQVSDVITRISFKPNTMGVLTFKPVGLLQQDQATQAKVYELWEKAPHVLGEIVGADDVAIDPAKWVPGRRAAGAVSDGTQRPNLAPPPNPQTAQLQPPAPFAQPPQGTPLAGPAPSPFAAPAAAPNGPAVDPNAQTAGTTQRTRRPRRTKEQMAADAAQQATGLPAQATPPAYVPPNPPLQGDVIPPVPVHQQQQPQGTPFVSGLPAGQPGDDIPPFLRRDNPPANKPAPSFGMEQPAAPSSDMQANIAAAFAVPLPPR